MPKGGNGGGGGKPDNSSGSGDATVYEIIESADATGGDVLIGSYSGGGKASNYAMTGGDDSLFFVSSDGEIYYIYEGEALDYESGTTSYEITVSWEVTKGKNVTQEETVLTINVTDDVSDNIVPPMDIDLSDARLTLAGDLNDDGFADLVIGMPVGSGLSDSTTAAVVILGSGSELATALDSAAVEAAASIQIVASLGSEAGFTVVNAGDIDGDGLDDLLISATRVDSPLLPTIDPIPSEGDDIVYLLYGSAIVAAASSLDPVIDLDALGAGEGFQIEGPAGSATGVSVTNAGDINGDTYDDIIIGASELNELYVFYGEAGPLSGSYDLQADADLVISGADNVNLFGFYAGDQTGYSVASGDFDGDGYDDILMGSPTSSLLEQNLNHSHEGAVSLTFGSGVLTDFYLYDSPASTSITIVGVSGTLDPNGPDMTGTSVAMADFNGDGFDDIIIGVPLYGGDDAGAVYVIYGASDPSTIVDENGVLYLADLDFTQGLIIEGNGSLGYEGFHVGIDVSGAGDVNGDGYEDIIIGTNGQIYTDSDVGTDGTTDADTAYLVFGSADYEGSVLSVDLAGATQTDVLSAADLIATESFALEITGDEGSLFGSEVAGGGDLNGDGFDDVTIAAPNALGGLGEVYVVYGDGEAPLA